MDMTIQEIRDSGLLELYVLGELSRGDQLIVNQALLNYPELKYDISEIESALQVFAQAQAVTPPDGIMDKVINQIKPSDITPPTLEKSPEYFFKHWMYLFTIMGLVAGGIYLFNEKNDLKQDFEAFKEECKIYKTAQEKQFALYEQIHDFDNQIIKIGVTENFPDTKLTLFICENTKQNLMQIASLASLTSEETYQLWSLKADQDPIPLNTFDTAAEYTILPMTYVENSSAYAITIEPKGGSLTPNLDKLIGVFSI